MDAAKLRMLNEHLGRRNFNDDQKSYWMGKHHELEKKKEGRPERKLPQNGAVSPRTSQQIAKQYHVSRQTVERSAQFTRAVDTIADKVGDDARTAILARDVKVTRQEVQKIAGLAFYTRMSIHLELCRGFASRGGATRPRRICASMA